MKIQKAIGVIQTDLQQFGSAKTIYDLAFRSINLLVYFKILRCMTIDTVDPAYLKLNDRYKCKFLDDEEVFKFAANGECEWPRGFLSEAVGKGDQCFGIIDGKSLASCGWYSNQPTGISDDLCFHFDRRYVYMYRGFTHPSYRGQHLHAIGMTMALNHYLNKGFKGLVAYVEDNNFASLKSVYRMGYKDFGRIYILGCFGKHLIHSSPGCYEYGVSITRRAADFERSD
jgi:ribosomal protein S18 acetylase RimI-like enzyme